MLIMENIGLAILGLKANKTRSCLTMLGIIIGIAAVIAILTVGDGINNSVMESMSDVGLNKISVSVQMKDYSDYDYYSSNSMKASDYVTEEMLSEFLTTMQNKVEAVCLSKSVGDAKAEDTGIYAKVSINGVNSGYLNDKKLTLLAGSLITKEEQESGNKVALVSDKFVNNMFGGDLNKACGQSINVVKDNKYYAYTIVGVYKYEESIYGFSSGPEKDISTDCYIPLKVALKQTRCEAMFTDFDVLARTGVDTNALAGEITSYFNERYYADNEKYEIGTFSMESMVKETSSMINMIRMALVLIAGISLLVGGIGVMNIMIVSVTERTREIGTRKALGATNGSIRLQFLTEAIVICFIGGAIGVIFGIGLGQVAIKAMGNTGHASVFSIIVCLIFSIGFGVFFGYYPANKAAKLNPIEALRYE